MPKTMEFEFYFEASVDTFTGTLAPAEGKRTSNLDRWREVDESIIVIPVIKPRSTAVTSQLRNHRREHTDNRHDCRMDSSQRDF